MQNKYRNLLEWEKEAKGEYWKNRYKIMIKMKKKNKLKEC